MLRPWRGYGRASEHGRERPLCERFDSGIGAISHYAPPQQRVSAELPPRPGGGRNLRGWTAAHDGTAPKGYGRRSAHEARLNAIGGAWQSCTRSEGHGVDRQLDAVIWVPHHPVYGSPQHACPDVQSADALQFRPRTHDRSVCSQEPLSEHVNHTSSPKGQIVLPGHVHGSPLSGSEQLFGNIDGAHSPTTERFHHAVIAGEDGSRRQVARARGVHPAER